jgi:hypothetical protein
MSTKAPSANRRRPPGFFTRPLLHNGGHLLFSLSVTYGEQYDINYLLIVDARQRINNIRLSYLAEPVAK